MKSSYGLKLNTVLEKLLPLIPKGKVLDIGAGQGRNSVFLAKNGFKVEAIDFVPEGLKKCQDFAKKHNLAIKTKVINVKKFKFKENYYSLVVARAILDFFKKSEIETIIKRIKKSLISDGFIYFLVFSTKDPLYLKIREKGIKEIEENTFYLPKFETYRHFFTENELKEIIKGLKIIYLTQRRIKDYHDKPHYHNAIEIVAQKKKATK